MPQFDTVIKQGTVIDGLRTPRFTADVGIKDGRIASIGSINASDGEKVLDASGLIVAPGFIDLHTHYDSQIFWDPYCSISGWHGVTSVVIGNCGFGFAPVKPEDQDRAMLTMARNEAVPLATQFWGAVEPGCIGEKGEWSATYDVGYHMFRPEQGHEILQDQLTKERYAEGLKGVVRKLCAERNVVLHGHGVHMFARSDRGSLNVFVSTSKQSREQRTAVELGITPEEAKKWLKRADREARSVFKNLIGSDLRDMGEFDIVLNTDKMSAKAAAKMVVGAVQEAAVQRAGADSVQPPASVGTVRGRTIPGEGAGRGRGAGASAA